MNLRTLGDMKKCKMFNNIEKGGDDDKKKKVT
jgi:hypothetical protein